MCTSVHPDFMFQGNRSSQHEKGTGFNGNRREGRFS